MAITAFVMWGFESMGLELENPFGYDANDPPLSEICATLRREIDYAFENPISATEDWESPAKQVSSEQLEKELAMENELDLDETTTRRCEHPRGYAISGEQPSLRVRVEGTRQMQTEQLSRRKPRQAQSKIRSQRTSLTVDC
jgi:hypothetical protein